MCSVEAVLAERLRRTLKARVRKSVGSIPTDCNYFLLPHFLYCSRPLHWSVVAVSAIRV